MGIPLSIKKRLERLEVYLAHLEEMKRIKKKDFLNDWKLQDIVTRNFQMCIESCVDIGTFIISQKGLKVPETYAGVIESLTDINILPRVFSEQFKDLVKFRNIIVHEYLYLDYNKIYKNLQKIGKIKEYIKCIAKFLTG